MVVTAFPSTNRLQLSYSDTRGDRIYKNSNFRVKSDNILYMQLEINHGRVSIVISEVFVVGVKLVRCS